MFNFSQVQDMITKAFNRKAEASPFTPVIYHLCGVEYPGVVLSVVDGEDAIGNPLPLACVSFIVIKDGKVRFEVSNTTFDNLDEIIAA